MAHTGAPINPYAPTGLQAQSLRKDLRKAISGGLVIMTAPSGWTDGKPVYSSMSANSSSPMSLRRRAPTGRGGCERGTVAG